MDESNNLSSVKRKMVRFRQSRRKQELDKYYEEKRSELLEQQDDEEQRQIINNLRQMMNNHSSRKQFLLLQAERLEGQPGPHWIQVIKTLRNVILFYNKDFSEWIEVKIIDRLISIFSCEQIQQSLFIDCCCLLTDLVYLMAKQIKYSHNQILWQKIIQSAIYGSQKENLKIQDKLKIYLLLSNLCSLSSNLRQKFFTMNGGYAFLKFWNQISISANKIEILQYLRCGEGVLTFHPDHVAICPIFTESLISIFSECLIKQKDNSYIRIILNCLHSILRLNNKHIINQVCRDDILIKIIDSVLYDDKNIRRKAIDCLSCISYTQDNDIIRKIIRLQTLDKLSELIQNGKQLNSKIMTVIIVMLSNFAVANEQITTLIYYHPIFSFVESCLNSTSMELQAQSFYFFNIILEKLQNFEIVQKIQKRSQLLRHVADSLIDYNKLPKSMIADLLDLICKLISFYSLTQGKVNPIIDRLVRIYNIEPLLQEIQQNLSKCDMIVAFVYTLQDIIGQSDSSC